MNTGIVSALGGGAGFDSQKLVTDLVNVQKEPLQLRIDNQKKDFDSQISAYGVLKSSMSELQGILTPLANPDTFNARAVNVPTTDVLSVNSLKSTAQPGTYKIEVEQVAAAQSLAFNVSATSGTAALGKTGELTFKVGQWAYVDPAVPGDPQVATTFTVNADKPSFKIQVDEADSLTDIAKKINDAESNVKASVLQVDGVSQLMITSESGEKNALKITTTDTDPVTGLNDFEFKEGGGNSAVLETQQGQDAKVKLNGLNVTRDNNEIDDVIPGFSFTLNKADVGNPITFSITEDRATAEAAIKSFVDGYNLFFETANELIGVKTDAETNATSAGELSKDGTAKSLLNLIRQTVGTSIPGLDKSGNLSALTNVGIRTARDGTLEIIEKDFREAFDNNFDQVATLFSQSTTTSSNAFEVSLGSYGGDAKAGKYDVHISQTPTKGYLEGGTLPSFPIDASNPADDYGFKVLVNGTTSGDMKLEGTYTNATELAAELQSLINGDSEIAKSKSFVDVTVEVNAAGDESIKLTSREYGDTSGVRFENAGAQFAEKVNITDATATTVGKDVAGTINGVAGFGSGDLLLAAIDTDSYGLNLKVKEGAATGDFTFNFSRGFAGELANLSERFLGKDGIIDTKEKSIQKDIKSLDGDQTKLDRRMTAYQEQLSAQFIAMERVVASLNSTKSQLTGLVDRLPFTAQK